MEALIVRLARENGSWGYDRIAGALKSLDHQVSDQTVGNVLRRHGIEPAPKRGQTLFSVRDSSGNYSDNQGFFKFEAQLK